MNDVLNTVFSDQRITQVCIGVIVLLFFLAVLSFIRKNRFAKKEKDNAQPEEQPVVIDYSDLISPAEYLKKCINAADSGTVPFDIADDFLTRLDIAKRDEKSDFEFKDSYSDIFYAWFNSIMGLINRYGVSDDEDICKAINSMIVADEVHSEYIDKMFHETETAKILSGELPFTEVCNWRKSFVNYEDVQKGRFQRFLSLQFMRFSKSKSFECPECLADYDSSLDEDNVNSIMEFLDICSRPRIESRWDDTKDNYEKALNLTESVLDSVNSMINDSALSEISEEDPNDSFFDEVPDDEENLTAEIESNENGADRLTTYESFFDSDTEADSIEEIKDISFSEEKISPPPDTFTLSVDPESISEPCEKKGKILRRIKIPNPKGEEDRLRDSIIVYGDQVEDTGQGFCLVTLPAEGERTLYKSRVVAEVLGKPVYENIKEIVSNLSIKDRFNDYYVSQLGAG